MTYTNCVYVTDFSRTIFFLNISHFELNGTLTEFYYIDGNNILEIAFFRLIVIS